MTEDGLRLTRHLRNRGRPTNSTWTKYKSQMKGKQVERSEGATTIVYSHFFDLGTSSNIIYIPPSFTISECSKHSKHFSYKSKNV